MEAPISGEGQRYNQEQRQAKLRDTRAYVSLEAIRCNTGLFRRQLNPRASLMAVVKANGYGHGAVEAAQAALEAGADRLGVAVVDEALQLRAAGIDRPILVLGYTSPSAVRPAVEHDVAVTVYSVEVLEALIAAAQSLGKKARMHLKLDTGMNRIGLSDPQEILALASRAHLSPFIELEGIFTHFADADGEHSAYTENQFAAFLEAIRLLERHGIRAPLLHCCNSAAAMRYPHMHLDMVRVGIALYGLHPSSHTRIAAYPLRPAMSLVAHIAAVKRIEPGQTVGYGCSFAAVRPTVVATIPIGYADGLSRRLSNKASALLHGVRVPYIGKICMDQAMLDITKAPSSAVGDPVVIFGSGDDALHNSVNSIPVDEIAALLDTIHYEVVCAVGSRVARAYR